MTDIDMNEKELNEFLSYCKECVKQIDHAKGIDDGLTDIKAIVFAGLVSYYGAAYINHIYLAFFKTDFIKCSGTLNDFLINTYGIKGDDLVKYQKHCPNVFYAPVALKNEKTNKYSVKRKVYVDDMLIGTNTLVQSIIHQVNHVVNSIYNPVVNKRHVGLGSRMGISFDCFSTRYCSSLELEEAINRLQVEEVMSKIVEFSFYDITVPGVSDLLNDIFNNISVEDNDSFDTVTEMVRPLYQDEKFNYVLVQRRLSGKLVGIRDEFDKKAGEGSYAQFLDICDKLSDVDDKNEGTLDEAKKLVKTYLEGNQNN